MKHPVAREDWLQVIRRAPLVSIDLILRDDLGRVLLGLRSNRPAQHTWFVPGGAMRKAETLDAAFARIAADEIGLSLRRADARFRGVYEHFYDDNFAGAPGFGTHYVVLAHELTVAGLAARGPLDQHRELRLFDVDELLARDDVHANTKAYFG